MPKTGVRGDARNLRSCKLERKFTNGRGAAGAAYELRAAAASNNHAYYSRIQISHVAALGSRHADGSESVSPPSYTRTTYM